MIEGADILARHFAGQQARFFPPLRIGTTPQAHELTADLILIGEKTATCSLPSTWGHGVRPFEGALQLLYGAQSTPCAILETTRVYRCPIGQITPDFVSAFAETDGTVAGFLRDMVPHYAAVCADAGQPFSLATPLLCEHFKLVRVLR